ncbi:hypothetical protein F8M41_015338 [Gigaspora margarita]|uniref:Uncharacterized protein n=1 Tax=Gigaspora margarita TaxID=4874 RepID=A0A8H3WU85_GIGMA|nr:hypothetical protein F8M41_015338 [Gigaspora margarita]
MLANYLPVLWIIIAILYTIYSTDQIPGSKDSEIVQVFFQIYIANIICMWLFIAFAISWSIKDCVNPDFANREFDNGNIP